MQGIYNLVSSGDCVGGGGGKMGKSAKSACLPPAVKTKTPSQFSS